MHTLLLFVHVAACFFMVLLILLQPSKGGGLQIYGGGGDALFSTSSGTSFMKRLTAGCAITFAVTSLLLTILSTRVGLESVTTQARFSGAPPANVPSPSSPASKK